MADNIWAVPLGLSNFNIVVALLGGWIALFGLVSYLIKERFYLSEALMSLLVGVAFGPHAANWIRPDAYAGCNRSDMSELACESNLNSMTLNFSRLVLGVQLVIAGVQLPSKYLYKELRPILLLVVLVMAFMWLTTSLLVWSLAMPHSIMQALIVGACVTPTDPVLSAVIVKGKFADKNIPKELQNLIVAESGANDGLGYPFLFFALYLIKFIGSRSNGKDGDGVALPGGTGDAMGLWFGMTLGYVIILSIIYGAVVGFLAKELLRWARRKKYVDDESFLVFAVALALFILGTCGLIGTDDVLACFIAGNTFTWDDWFRIQTKDDSLQPTIDMLLNVSIFMWYGAVVPWTSFRTNSVIPIYKLIALGILVLLLRRLPWILGVHKFIPQIEHMKQAIFVGFFGPIGVSAVFYLFITLEFIEEHLSSSPGVPRSDVTDLPETVRVVVWFLCVCSIVVHGLSIPLGKVGYGMPRSFSRAISQSEYGEEIPRTLHYGRRIPVIGPWLTANRASGTISMELRNRFRDVRDRSRERQTMPSHVSISAPMDPRKMGTVALGGGFMNGGFDGAGGGGGLETAPVLDVESGGLTPASGARTPVSGARTPAERVIRFGDEVPPPRMEDGSAVLRPLSGLKEA